MQGKYCSEIPRIVCAHIAHISYLVELNNNTVLIEFGGKDFSNSHDDPTKW